MLHKAVRTSRVYTIGRFTITRSEPGSAIPGHNDHGYGPLAIVDDATIGPGMLIKMHEHRNDEIVSYVPQDLIRHDDSTGTELVIDKDHLMVMNAGRSFWHEERTMHDDETARVLQIFVRPHTIDLEPRLQFRKLEPAEPNTWRLLFGPEGSDAPSHVRNAVYLHDIRLEAGCETNLPMHEDWNADFYVYTGLVEAPERNLRRRRSWRPHTGTELATASASGLLGCRLSRGPGCVNYDSVLGRSANVTVRIGCYDASGSYSNPYINDVLIYGSASYK